MAGEVVGVTWASEATGFAVLRVRPEPGRIVVAVGTLAHVRPGEAVTLVGRWEDDPAHGRQLKVRWADAAGPASPEGLERYLASGFAPGIGKGLARRLVETLGPRLTGALEGDLEALAAVPGIGANRARALMDAWARERGAREAMIRLEGAGVGPALAARIQRRYGDDTVRVIQEDPYRLAEEVRGVGFLRADALARSLGVAQDSPGRGRAAVTHLLRRASERGHAALPEGELWRRAGELEVDEAVARVGLAQLLEEGAVIRDEAPGQEALLYLSWMWRVEVEIAARLTGWAPPEAAVADPSGAVAEAERHLGFALGADQRRAVALALASGLLVITGGPGTGKTTLVKALAALLGGIPGGLALAAPTGRAAKRMQEVTGHPASTLHRLLEVRPPGMDFGRHPARPLPAGAVLVDEASMIDLPLMRGLLRAMRPGARLLLVGDADQLPPVGPGEAFRDLVEAGSVEVVRLGTLYRQEAGSLIAANAHRIVRGDAPRVLRGEASRDADFFIIEALGPQVAEIVVDLVARRLPQARGLDPRRDIQVLTPGHRGDVGAVALGRALQARLNPSAEGEAGPRIRAGDRILQTRNNYDLELFNGDIGLVEGIRLGDRGALEAISARFDDRLLELSGAALDDLDLAWALTVHKSQGSEYPAVVMPVSSQHAALLDRSLLYTAVTRARGLVVLVGDRRAVDAAAARGGRGRRHGLLLERLKGLTPRQGSL